MDAVQVCSLAKPLSYAQKPFYQLCGENGDLRYTRSRRFRDIAFLQLLMHEIDVGEHRA